MQYIKFELAADRSDPAAPYFYFVDRAEGRLGLPDRAGQPDPRPVQSGPTVEDVFCTISTGLSGSPMPSFRDAFAEPDRWALAYCILSLSAYSDPLTGEQPPISEMTRAALDNPKLVTAGPEQAYGLQRLCGGVSCPAPAPVRSASSGAVK